MALKSLIINPGSTSTKVGIFEDETCVVDETLRHSTEEISQYPSIIAQKDFRKNIILDFLNRKLHIHAVITRQINDGHTTFTNSTQDLIFFV